MYKYSYTNKRRSKCPFCGKDGKYSACENNYTKELAGYEFGRCSSCQQYKLPPDYYINSGDTCTVENDYLGYFEADTININRLNQYNEDLFNKYGHLPENSFIDAMCNMFGKDEVKRVFNLYNVGRFSIENSIVFPYLCNNTHCCTAKILFYEGLHREKEIKKKIAPKFLHNLRYNDNGIKYDYNDYEEYTDKNGNDIQELIPFKLKLCLFGHHLILNDLNKTICLVESEKTALIMSIILPEFIWVGAGGNTWIQYYKFLFFSGRKCLVFPDMSENDITYKMWYDKLNQYGYDFEFIDYYSEYLCNDSEMINHFKEKGWDIADFITDFDKKSYVNFIKNKLEKYI
jgi:hypothetical protein